MPIRKHTSNLPSINWLLAVIAMTGLMVTTETLGSVRLPKLVGDNMVLQRDTPLRIWGWADADEQVTVSFRGHKASTKTNDKGEWSVMLPAQRMGGPFTMDIAGSNAISLKNILVGDVWLASGQSNMEWPLDKSFEAGPDIAASANPMLRLFLVPKTKADEPRDDRGVA